jgi:hypothetical protein
VALGFEQTMSVLLFYARTINHTLQFCKRRDFALSLLHQTNIALLSTPENILIIIDDLLRDFILNAF